MRVFHLVKGLGRGGAETLLVRTASTDILSARRNAYGYFLPWKDALVPELRESGCLVRCFPARNPAEMFLRLPQMIMFLRRWRPDLIHAHLPLAGVVARIAGRILRIPVIYTEHNLQERYHPLTRLANRLTWGLQARVVAVSAEVEGSISRSLPGKTVVQTVLNGVDCEKFCPAPRVREETRDMLGLSSADFLVGTVAVFRRQKRLDLWLEVAKRLSEEFPDVHFLLVGDGPEKDIVERLVLEFGLQSRVHLPGLTADVRPYYCAMDAFFMSSDFEGLPVAMLEAMATQIPVVATSAGGIGEVVREPLEGLLAPVGDTAQLLSHLRGLCVDVPMARETGKNGRVRVRESFSLSRMSQELEELYKDVLGWKSKPKRERLDGYRYAQDIPSEEAVELISLALGPGSERSPRTLEFFDWKHKENHFGVSFSLGAYASSAEQLAALRLFQRWALVRDSSTFRAVRAVDTSTHPHHQRRGLFTALTTTALTELHRESVDIVFNTPNTNSLPGYLKMGWEMVDQISLKVKWLRGRARSRTSSGLTLEDLLGSCSASAVDKVILDSRVKGKLQIAKSLGYLSWRYGGHPTVDYHFLASCGGSGGEMDALLVWSETTRSRFLEFSVCELFARTAEAGYEILERALGSSRCHYAVWASSSNSLAEAVIREQGFSTVLFKKIALAAFPLNERAAFCVAGENWCLSTGDLQVF